MVLQLLQRFISSLMLLIENVLCTLHININIRAVSKPTAQPPEDSSLFVGIEATNTADLDGVIKDAGGNLVVFSLTPSGEGGINRTGI